jgi:hypothetical protein
MLKTKKYFFSRACRGFFKKISKIELINRNFDQTWLLS